MNNPGVWVVLFRNTGLTYRMRRRIGLGFMVDVPGRSRSLPTSDFCCVRHVINWRRGISTVHQLSRVD